MTYKYDVTVAETAPVAEGGASLGFSFESHDDLAQIVQKVRDKNLFPDGEAETFAVGLKMFAGVVLAHRGHPLFSAFAPHFGAFMKALKA